MWKKLSLRMRLLLPLGTMFVAALLLGAVSLQLFAPGQLIEENEPATRCGQGGCRSAQQRAADVDQSATDPRRIRTIARHIRNHPVPAQWDRQCLRTRRCEVHTPLGNVPRWFVDLLGLPEIGASFPVTIEGKAVGDIVFSPDISADIYEKWIGFLALVSSGIVLMLLTGTIAYFTAGTVVDGTAESGRRADPDAHAATTSA